MAIVNIAIGTHVASTCLLVVARTGALVVGVAVDPFAVSTANVVHSSVTPKFHLPCRCLLDLLERCTMLHQ